MFKYVLELTGEVNYEMYSKMFKAYNDIRDNSEVNELVVVLNTEGGEVYQGLGIHDLIIGLPNRVHTTVMCCGHVMSSGMFILQAAQHRVATPNAYIMVHYGELSSSSASEQKHNKDLVDLHTEMCYNRTTVSRKTIKSWNNGDHYFSATRALEVGLIDEIL